MDLERSKVVKTGGNVGDHGDVSIFANGSERTMEELRLVSLSCAGFLH